MSHYCHKSVLVQTVICNTARQQNHWQLGGASVDILPDLKVARLEKKLV